MKRHNIVYLGPPETESWVREFLGADYDVWLCLDVPTTERVLPDAHAILDAYMKVPFPAKRLSLAHALKVIVTATTGADHIDEKVLQERGIPLLTLRGQRELLQNLTPAAEHSWLLLMSCARRIRGAVETVLHGEWNRNAHPGIMLRGRTLGIIGCGRIGQWMARYAAAFGMDCLGYDPHVTDWPQGIARVDLDALLERADFVSIHVTLSDQTRGLLGTRHFARMKPGACLVNTSRGEVLDEGALLEALQSGRLHAVGLDVLQGEPDVRNSPLLEYARMHSNLIITPHIGGFSPDALRQVLEFSCRRLGDYLKESV